MKQHPSFTFTKNERLCRKSIIDTLFEKGNRSLLRFPFRFIYVQAPIEGGFSVQVMITVSRRNFPKSTQRNRIKRQLRELYRTHKHLIYEKLKDKPQRFALMISYQAKTEMSFSNQIPLFKKSILQIADDMEKKHTATVSGTDKSL